MTYNYKGKGDGNRHKEKRDKDRRCCRGLTEVEMDSIFAGGCGLFDGYYTWRHNIHQLQPILYTNGGPGGIRAFQRLAIRVNKNNDCFSYAMMCLARNTRGAEIALQILEDLAQREQVPPTISQAQQAIDRATTGGNDAFATVCVYTDADARIEAFTPKIKTPIVGMRIILWVPVDDDGRDRPHYLPGTFKAQPSYRKDCPLPDTLPEETQADVATSSCQAQPKPSPTPEPKPTGTTPVTAERKAKRPAPQRVDLLAKKAGVCTICLEEGHWAKECQQYIDCSDGSDSIDTTPRGKGRRKGKKTTDDLEFEEELRLFKLKEERKEKLRQDIEDLRASMEQLDFENGVTNEPPVVDWLVEAYTEAEDAYWQARTQAEIRQYRDYANYQQMFETLIEQEALARAALVIDLLRDLDNLPPPNPPPRPPGPGRVGPGGAQPLPPLIPAAYYGPGVNLPGIAHPQNWEFVHVRGRTAPPVAPSNQTALLDISCLKIITGVTIASLATAFLCYYKPEWVQTAGGLLKQAVEQIRSAYSRATQPKRTWLQTKVFDCQQCVDRRVNSITSCVDGMRSGYRNFKAYFEPKKTPMPLSIAIALSTLSLGLSTYLAPRRVATWNRLDHTITESDPAWLESRGPGTTELALRMSTRSPVFLVEMRPDCLVGKKISVSTVLYVRDGSPALDDHYLDNGCYNPAKMRDLTCNGVMYELCQPYYCTRHGANYWLFPIKKVAQSNQNKLLSRFTPNHVDLVQNVHFYTSTSRMPLLNDLLCPTLDASYRAAYTMYAGFMPVELKGIYVDIRNEEFASQNRTGVEPRDVATSLVGAYRDLVRSHGARQGFSFPA